MSDKLPFKNIRLAITRAEHQAQIQREQLEALGAEVFHYPCIQILPLKEFGEMDAALARASNGAFDWIVFTSANTVTRIAERMKELDLPPRSLVDLKIASVGPKTEQRVQQVFGLQSAALPPTYTASELAKVLDVKAGDQVFLPQSSLARLTMLNALQSAGADVTHVAAYRTQIAQGGDHVPAMLWEGKIDAITFTSESTVRFFARRIDYEQGTVAMLDDVCVACIGPVTAAAAESLGISVQLVPDEHTLDGLHAALIDYFRS